MTQLEFSLNRRGQSQDEKLRAYLLARPLQWIPMVELGSIIGAWAVHSRAAALRRKFGMTIENKKQFDPVTRKNLSQYRYVPTAPSDSQI